MGPLEQAKSELIRQFETLATTDQQPAIARLQTKMKLGVDLLAWMKGQLVYPQFYLRFRDEDKTVAAVGKVRSFSDVNLAQQFIQEHDFPLVGGLQFQGESQFILPQVLIEQQNGETVVSVFVETNELDSAKAVLNSFEKTTALLPQDVQATLAEITVHSIVLALNNIQTTLQCRLLVCGGGAKNQAIMSGLKQALTNWRNQLTTELALDID